MRDSTIATALDRRLDEFRIAEQNRLLAESREAHFRGELGLATMLEQAAERVMTPQQRGK